MLLLAVSAVFLSSSSGISSIFPSSKENTAQRGTVDGNLTAPGKPEPAANALPSDINADISPGEKIAVEEIPKVVAPDIQGVIGRNNTVYGKLISCGLSPTQIFNLTQSFNKTFDFRAAAPDDRFQIFLAGNNQLQKFIYSPDPLLEYIAERDENGDFKVAQHDLIPEKRVEAMEISLDSSLSKAILNTGEKQRLVDQFVDIFSWDIDFYLFPRKGDRITILYEKYFMEDTFIKYGDILAARYAGQNGTFSSFFFDGEIGRAHV